MSGPKNLKRGAQGDKGGHNPINSRVPEEYICLVGSPSNTFNGYYYIDPATNDFVPMAHPKNLKGVSTYIKGYPAQNKPAVTHDLYWANFVDPAIRLFYNGVAQPKPGDIVSVMVYLKGYLWRSTVDWDASPYNLGLHENSPWVRNNPKYNPGAQGGTPPPPPPPSPFKPPSKPKPIQSADWDDENIIDHDILMRTTSDNTDTIIKRPSQPGIYEDYIHNIPRRIVFGPELGGEPKIKDILVKLLLFNEVKDFLDYLKTGQWTGPYWKHILDTVSETDMSRVPLDVEGSFYDAAITFSSRAWASRWKRLLKTVTKMPGVNRSKVKIRRFDYFGHSGDDSFWPLYGWANAKGELPNKEMVVIDAPTFESALEKKTLSKKSFAQLWGCNLGTAMAPALIDKFDEIVACEDATDFENILDTDTSLPTPTAGTNWKTYKRKRP